MNMYLKKSMLQKARKLDGQKIDDGVPPPGFWRGTRGRYDKEDCWF